MLDNILQECQIDEIGALNQTSNFCNELLADDELHQLDLLNVQERKGKRKLGYCSEYVEHGGKRRKVRSNRCQRVVGSSSFELLQALPKEILKKIEIKDDEITDDCFVPPIEVKMEVDSDWKVNITIKLIIKSSYYNKKKTFCFRILLIQQPPTPLLLANQTKECVKSQLLSCNHIIMFRSMNLQLVRPILRVCRSIQYSR